MLKRWYSNLPLNHKIFLLTSGIMTVLSLLALVTLFAITLNLTNDRVTPKTLESVASIFRHPVTLNDIVISKQSADKNLAWLQEYPLVDEAGLYIDGRLFSVFPEGNDTLPTRISGLPNFETSDKQFYLATLQEGSPAVHLFLKGFKTSLTNIYKIGLLAFIIMFISALGLTLIGTRIVQRSITKPVTHLMNIARMVSANEDYQVRAQKLNNDEIGALVDAFNTMLNRIETRDHQLLTEKDKAERTQMQAQELAAETREANKRLEFEVHVRTKIERKLTDFQSYLNSIINSMPSALIAVDEHFFITLWNKEASMLSGTPLESALGYSLEEAFPMLGNYMDDISHALIERETKTVEKVTFFDSLNQEHQLDLIIYPLNRTGTLGAVIRIDDVSSKIQMEEVMVQTEKMMSVGGLAAGMAHEINNPLSAIVQGAQNIKRRLSPDIAANIKTAEELGIDLDTIRMYLANRQIMKFLDNIQDAGERAAHIVTNMLQFSRQSSRTLALTSIPDLLDQAVEIAGSDYDLKKGYDFKRLKLVKEYDENNILVPCARQEIEQVLLNLFKNAAQAIKERGDKNVDLNYQGQIRISCHFESGHCVIGIEDNGIGMDAETRKRVFEPFFTTKDVGVGTGLGLSVSYFIITSHHGGTMDARSEKLKGTCFTIRLPLTTPVDTDKNPQSALTSES